MVGRDARTVAAAAAPRPRRRLACPSRRPAGGAPEDEQVALAAARLFTDYLRAGRAEPYGLSLLPPGRFLMPGDLEGSPALTFAPLDAAG